MATTTSSFLSLPPEIVLQILSNLPIPSVHSTQLTCRAINALVTSSTVIYRALALNHGYLDERSSAASGVHLRRAVLAEEYDPDEFRRALVAQSCIGPVYANVHDWKAFAQTRMALDRNWRKGVPTETTVSRLSCPNRAGFDVLEGGIWRFKLDPSIDGVSPGTWATSGVHGGFQIFNFDGSILWQTVLPTTVYPHVELSEGHLVMMESPLTYIVWRRNSIASPPPLLTEDERLDLAMTTAPALANSPAAYSPFCRLTATISCRATKCRYPYFVGISPAALEVQLFDLRTGKLVKSFAIAEFEVLDHSRNVQYVELDKDYVFVAGVIGVYAWTHEGEYKGSFGVPDGSGYFPSWEAVHHDTKGGHLLAGSSNGTIVWCWNYRGVLAGETTEAESSVVLELDVAHGEYKVLQLSVENDRCVFITENESCRYSLWLINLRNYDSLDDFRANPSHPICLCPALPTLTCPSRVEQSSDGIFLPIHSPLLPGGLSHPEFVQTHEPPPVEYEWLSTEMDILAAGIAGGKGVNGKEYQYQEKKWRAFARLAGQMVGPWKADTVLGFGFGGADLEVEASSGASQMEVL